MCRLLGYVARRPLTPAQVLGETLPAFVDTSHAHGDGWGMAWYDEWNHLQCIKSSEAAHANNEIFYQAEHLRTDALIAHMRSASPGFSIELENTHPFIYEHVAFAHNGLISPIHTLETLVAPHLRATIKGTADSERHFLALLSALENMRLSEGIIQYFTVLHQQLEIISANCLLLTPDLLCAICDYDPASFPERNEPGHFHLQYRVTPDEVLIGSTGLQQGPEWQLLENGHMLLVHRQTLQIEGINIFDTTYGICQIISDEEKVSINKKDKEEYKLG